MVILIYNGYTLGDSLSFSLFTRNSILLPLWSIHYFCHRLCFFFFLTSFRFIFTTRVTKLSKIIYDIILCLVSLTLKNHFNSISASFSSCFVEYSSSNISIYIIQLKSCIYAGLEQKKSKSDFFKIKMFLQSY